MVDAALVLEGGALRTVYTAGVLDTFLENGVHFSYCIGTSSGSLSGLNYISRQPGRTFTINMDFHDDPEYISLRNRFRHGGVFNLDFLFEEPQGRWEPFDEEFYERCPARYVVVATSCETGQPVYFEKPTGPALKACLKASCGLPILSSIISTSQGKCLDGGITDSIPFTKPLEEGYEKMVVIKTRDATYRKPETPAAARVLCQVVYKRYPRFLEALWQRPQRYNAQLDAVYALKAQGRAYIIEPETPVTVSRIERDRRKLEELYAQGRAQARRLLPELRHYLKETPSFEPSPTSKPLTVSKRSRPYAEEREFAPEALATRVG